MNSHNEQFDQIPESVKQLVIVRLAAMPSGYRISIGSQGSFTKDELIEHVKEGDEVGNTIVKVNLEFLRSLMNGKLLNELVSVPE